MPWLSRSNSPNRIVTSQAPEDVIHKSALMDSSVTFIPAMIDGSCGTTPLSFRETPLQLLLNDLKIIGQNFACVPEMARSLCTLKSVKDLFESWRAFRDLLLQILLALIEIVALVMAVPMFLALPGGLFLGGCLIFGCVVALLSMPLKGSRILRNRHYAEGEFDDERWVFVNGSLTSHNQLRNHLSKLSDIFGRPVVGVHNRTNGIVLDLFSSLLAHCISFTTPTSTNLYTQLREPLLSPTMRKVIVLGHGTGAHLISLALDKLHADLPIDVLAKLEIYTFGSGATHLSNPPFVLEGSTSANGLGTITRADGSIISPVKATLASRGYRTEDTERVLPHCEHYALSNDITAKCGILHHTRNTLDNRFCGRVFAIDRPGFLLTHYLNTLFPINPLTTPNKALDEIVSVEVQTAEKREFTAQGVSMPLKTLSHSPRNSLSPLGSPRPLSQSAKEERRRSWNIGGIYGTGMDSIGQARNSARENEGKSVRQLSRLWRYVGGARPVGEGVPATNGVGVAAPPSPQAQYQHQQQQPGQPQQYGQQFPYPYSHNHYQQQQQGNVREVMTVSGANEDEEEHVEWHDAAIGPFNNDLYDNEDRNYDLDEEDEVQWHDALFEFVDVSDHGIDFVAITDTEINVSNGTKEKEQHCTRLTLDDQTTFHDAGAADWGMDLDLARDVDVTTVASVDLDLDMEVRSGERNSNVVVTVQQEGQGTCDNLDMLVALWI
ncbi:hypothetical protein BP5796_07754 [Coleophoma crateriformis]|uniref:Uncharacterized protein n=1 Tax=Coleophoma crateriformis TaxID=565419 RepID=A0A3D8RCL7_9HELO|nr:hypothetical protein BP5796_07754 [Coleophoma crateriformis]